MLFHGTNKKISYLKPYISYELINVVYATDDIFYALIRCGRFDIAKCFVREEHGDRQHSLCEMYDGAFEDLFNCDGYIHIVDNAGFKQLYPAQFTCDRCVEIKHTIYIPNVLEALKRHSKNINLIYNNNSDDYWANVRGGKEGYLERTMKYRNMVLEKRLSS